MKNFELKLYSLLDEFSKLSEDKKRQVAALIVKDNNVISYGVNKIPESLCNRIARNNMNQMIFFTDITAVNDEGKIIILTSFNLIPSKK
jgi:deoxycytidylate deaminase